LENPGGGKIGFALNDGRGTIIMIWDYNEEDLRSHLKHHLWHSLAKDHFSATKRDRYITTALTARDYVTKKWIETQQRYYDRDTKRVYYLSLEFLLGRLLMNTILNLGMEDAFSEAADVLETNLESVVTTEWDAGLGHGGLGRLAACFLDSMATLGIPGYGYGIRYEYGIFFQRIRDGYQVETPDNWLRYGIPWEFPRPSVLYMVRYHGRVNAVTGGDGRKRMELVDTDNVMAMAYDYPVPGYRNGVVNTLRLWSAKSTREFDLDYFNSGDYVRAMAEKDRSESISKVLYPNDTSLAGKELRLKQQYFFSSATLQDIIRRFLKGSQDFSRLPDKVAIQLNDTHPSIAIPELMRILVDDHGIDWDDAWNITTRTFSYTNHTILPEALETWPEEIIGSLLPRHYQIIQEIDRRFLIQVAYRFPEESKKTDSMAIVTRQPQGTIHMARLAIVGSRKVNGVSALHSDILKKTVFHDFSEMWPDKFTNVTNGVTPRRWILEANPSLSRLLCDRLGDSWVDHAEKLRDLEPLADDPDFRNRFMEAKTRNKERLVQCMDEKLKVRANPSLFLDCQVKRFHEYKRQLLNILHVLTLYNRIVDGTEGENFLPRTVLFSGKTAPGYAICKLIIKLIHSVAAVIDAHPRMKDKLKVCFVPNYSVSAAQIIIPAAELSEQISTAGFEASGTGNMKFTMNGSLTIGTLDGANVEIREQVGEENFFLFGMKADETFALRGHYDPAGISARTPELQKILDQLTGGYYSPGDRDLFKPITQTLLNPNDRFFVLADYEDYVRCQASVAEAYRDRDRWAKMAILNVARSGIFSSDRSIQEYAKNIWEVNPILP